MRFSYKKKQLLYFELAKFVRSGFGFEKACEAILEQRGAPSSHRVFCREVLRGLKDKKTVGQAIAGVPLKITPLELNLIEAGENAGLLEQSFEHLEQHFKLAIETRKRIIKSLTYPIILLHVGVLLGLVALSVISIANPEYQKGDALNSISRGLMVFGIVYLVSAVLGLVLLKVYRLGKVSPLADQLLRLLPLLGKMRHFLSLTRFCEVFHMGLRSGQKIDQCLSHAGGSSGSGMLLRASSQGLETVRQGNTLASALEAFPKAFPGDFRRSVANAELSGVLDEDFARWREYYRQSALEAVERLAVWAPRLFYWAVMLVVAGIIIKMGLAYAEVIQGILDWGDQF